MESSVIIYYILLIIAIISSIEMKTSIQRRLPLHLKIGYANWNECDDKIIEAVENGLNVIIWFSIDLASDPQTKKPVITRGPDYKKVAEITRAIKDKGYNVLHLISIGGWNSPHPDNSHSGSEYYDEWLNFNKRISIPEFDFYGFDGFDWDIEGNDDMKSPSNHFTISTLDIMGQLSQLAKKGGFIVSMAPAESYLDPTTNDFSFSLLNNYKEWEEEFPQFTYHGRNIYAYLLMKYGETTLSSLSVVKTFDFISIQLYEGYSHTLYQYERLKKPFGKILLKLINELSKGWLINFDQEKETGLDKEYVSVEMNRIVIGLGNAWANERFLFIPEKDIFEAYDYCLSNNAEIKGYMFWNIQDEGRCPLHSTEPYYLAKILNKLYKNEL